MINLFKWEYETGGIERRLLHYLIQTVLSHGSPFLSSFVHSSSYLSTPVTNYFHSAVTDETGVIS